MDPETAFWVIAQLLHGITTKLEKIMTEDAEVLAVVSDEQAQNASLAVVLTNVQGLVAQIVAEQAAGQVQPSTVAALQAQQTALDAAVSALQSADVVPTTTPPAAERPTLQA